MKRAAIIIVALALALYVLVYRLLPPYGTEGFWPVLLGIIALTAIGIAVTEYVLRKRKLINPPH